MAWKGPVAAGVQSYLRDAAVENVVKLCQDQICASKAFGGCLQSRTPEFSWLGPAEFHRSLEVMNRIRCGLRMVQFPPFLSGSCLFFLGWQTVQNHLGSRPAGSQGQTWPPSEDKQGREDMESCRVQAASEYPRESILSSWHQGPRHDSALSSQHPQSEQVCLAIKQLQPSLIRRRTEVYRTEKTPEKEVGDLAL